MILRAIGLMIFAAMLLAPIGAGAQTPPPAAPNAPLLKPAELDQLVAPIALYPDPLLAEVLMASSYPLDVVEAERWLQNNKNLKGDALKAAADKQDWDDSIKALVATPDVLDMMSQKLDWTQKLGDAVVAQQADVMDAIQRLRAKAQANNKLASTKEQTVTVSKAEGRQVIAIAPTDPNTLYVPYYDPGVVYGDWPYADYPPYYWPAPGYIGAGIVATGIAFGAGYALGRWASGGRYWGGNFNWNNNNINIDRPINGGGANWKPRVDHRQSAGNRGGRQQGGLNFRGNGGQQVIKPGGGNRGNLAGQNRPANRPSAGAGAGNRPHAGTRPSGGGQRHKAAQRPSGGGQRHRAAQRPSGGGGARVSHRGGGGGGAALPTAAAARRAPMAVAACGVAVARAAAVAAVAVAVAVAADGDPTSGSSTTSSCSAISTTASASIASATTAATRPMSASWRRRCSGSCRKQSGLAATAI